MYVRRTMQLQRNITRRTVCKALQACMSGCIQSRWQYTNDHVKRMADEESIKIGINLNYSL